jgi:sporulation protein YlmC with PRC-barrel domain
VRQDRFDIVYRLLDDDLIDSEGRRCGRVDDIEIEGKAGDEAYIAAILTGSGAWSARLPRRLRRAGARIFGDRYKRIPWERVKDIGETVELKDPGSKFGIGEADIWATRVIKRVPGS